MESEWIRQLNPRLYVTDNVGGLTVYLDSRLLVQIRDGTVTAAQTYNLAQAKLANRILKGVGIDNVTLVPGMIITYKEGVPDVKTDNQ